MRKQLNALPASQKLEASKTFNEILKRHGDSMEFNQNNWTVGLINRATSLWMLATSPVYYLQNLTQPFMLSLPVMTERHNYIKAANALTKAYAEAGALFKDNKADGDLDFTKFPADVRKMLETLSDRGRIQISMDAELGQVRITPSGTVSKAWNKVDRLMRAASEKIEAINRVTTAMAAYRMELAKTGDMAKAIDYADSIIERTHGDYTSINASRAFNTNLGRVTLQFRKFQLIQGTLLIKLAYNSVKGESAEVRAGARTALAFTLGHTAVMCGTTQLPGFALLAFLLSNLGRLWQEPEDEPFDLEQELRKMIGDEDTANLILRGAPNLAGIDLSTKLGMGNVFSIVPYSDVELSRKGFNEIATGLVLGASGAVGAKVFDGLGQVAKGEYYRGLETLMPTGIANGMKAYREQESGATKRNGDITLPADEIDAFDTFATAIGLTTTKKALQSQRTEQKYQTEQHFNELSDRIRNEFLQAKKNGESTQEAIDKWRALQNKKAEMGFKRQGVDALYKAAQQQRTREKHVIEGIPYNKTNKKYVEQLTNV
jgi:predicted phage tail protein